MARVVVRIAGEGCGASFAVLTRHQPIHKLEDHGGTAKIERKHDQKSGSRAGKSKQIFHGILPKISVGD